MAPEGFTVWIGLDVGKEEHCADVLDDHGDGLFHRSVVNDEADLDALIARRFVRAAASPGSVCCLPPEVAGYRADVAASLSSQVVLARPTQAKE